MEYDGLVVAGLEVLLLEGVTTVRVTVELGLVVVVVAGLVVVVVVGRVVVAGVVVVGRVVVAGVLVAGREVVAGVVVVGRVVVAGLASVLAEETLVTGLDVVVVVVAGLLVVASVLEVEMSVAVGLVVPVEVGPAVIFVGLFTVPASMRAPVTVGLPVAEVLLPLLLKELPVPVVPAASVS